MVCVLEADNGKFKSGLSPKDVIKRRNDLWHREMVHFVVCGLD